jgi:hypothetical protein
MKDLNTEMGSAVKSLAILMLQLVRFHFELLVAGRWQVIGNGVADSFHFDS